MAVKNSQKMAVKNSQKGKGKPGKDTPEDALKISMVEVKFRGN